MMGTNIPGASVSDVAAVGLMLLESKGIQELTRNGPALVMPGPVLIRSTDPRQRVLFSPVRNANPFFHLFEALWMLAGRNDIAWVAQFNKRMASYSDDGATQPAAYGFRWREHFGNDQLDFIVDELRRDPSSRRAVLAMWDGMVDPANVANRTADAPCNTNCFFRIRAGHLHMSVQCRSNDAIWGAHGANAVHFSILQEYLAARLGVGMGDMFQYAWNYHAYVDVMNAMGGIRALCIDLDDTDLYADGSVRWSPLITEDETSGQFMSDVEDFINLANPKRAGQRPLRSFETEFMQNVALPMLHIWDSFKLGHAPAPVNKPSEVDWLRAGQDWVARRWAAKLEKAK